MADGHGGYRKPSSPAAVSGPGAHSQRTDGRPQMAELSDAKYGEAANFREIQQGASMGQAPSAPSGGGAAPVAAPTGLMDPSQMADQPVTAGADAGAGPGSDALGLPSTEFSDDIKRRLAPLLPYLIRRADAPDASDEAKAQVRYLIANL